MKLLTTNEVRDKEAFFTKQYGCVFEFDAGNYNLSSTHIREAIHNNKNLSKLIPNSVEAYIKSQGLYR